MIVIINLFISILVLKPSNFSLFITNKQVIYLPVYLFIYRQATSPHRNRATVDQEILSINKFSVMTLSGKKFKTKNIFK